MSNEPRSTLATYDNEAFEAWFRKRAEERGRRNMENIFRLTETLHPNNQVYAEVDTYFAFIGWCAGMNHTLDRIKVSKK